MTLEELLAREAIRATMARCAQAGDSLRAEEYAACFTVDGVLRTQYATGRPGLDLAGRAAILDWQNGLTAPGQGLGVPGQPALAFSRHNLTSSKIELTGPDEAKVRTYWFVVTNAGPDHSGTYRDTFRREQEEWLIAERRVKTEWVAAATLMVRPENRP